MLAATVLLLLVLFVELATRTSRGVTADLGRAAAAVPDAAREFLLAVTQIVAVAFPVLVVAAIVAHRRWRRLGVVVLAAGAGAALFALLDVVVDVGGSVPRRGHRRHLGGVDRLPVAGLRRGRGRGRDRGEAVVAPFVAAVRRPEPARARRRAGRRRYRRRPRAAAGRRRGGDRGRGGPGRARRPEPPADPGAVVGALRAGGLAVGELALERADGGRAQLYVAALEGGDRAFVKVYARDSRDADLLYRGYRTALFRGANDDWPAMSLAHDVEHEALLLLLAQRAGVSCPAVRALCALDDGSMALALEYVDGRPLDALAPTRSTPACSTRVARGRDCTARASRTARCAPPTSWWPRASPS